MENMKKAVIYARYSCDKQNYQSIEGQLRVCNKFASDNGFIVVDTYIDTATTGTNDKRYYFQQMLQDSINKNFEIVIVYKNDRFARNRVESALNKKILKDNGVRVISATENIPDTPEGIILESLLEGMAEYYSVELSQKVKRGMNELFIKKQFTGGNIPFGYDIVNKKYVINTYESEIVKKIFKDFASGKTKALIVEELSAKGVLNKNKKPITYSSLSRMLQNLKYTGIVMHDGKEYQDIVPQIIDKELFDKVNSQQKINKRINKVINSNFILSGKLFCGICKNAMHGDSGTSKTGAIYYYYTCHAHKKNKGCRMPSIKKESLENKIFEICATVLKKDYVQLVIDNAYKIHLEELESNADIQNLDNQLDKKKKALNNMLNAIESGIFTSSTQQRLLELEKDIEILNTKINEEKEKQNFGLTKADYFNFLNKFIDKQIDNEEFKKDLINLLIKKIIVYPEKIKIIFNITNSDTYSNENLDFIDFLEDFDKKNLSETESSNKFRLVTRGRIELPIQP